MFSFTNKKSQSESIDFSQPYEDFSSDVDSNISIDHVCDHTLYTEEPPQDTLVLGPSIKALTPMHLVDTLSEPALINTGNM